MGMLWGLLAGTLLAVADGLLLFWVLRGAAARKEKARQWLFRGMAARGLLTLAVVALALLLPFVNAAGVVVALIVQKAVLVAMALLQKKDRG